jgi:hypothetical protein
MNRHDLVLRLRALFRKQRVESELEEEIAAHLELQVLMLAIGMGVNLSTFGGDRRNYTSDAAGERPWVLV